MVSLRKLVFSDFEFSEFLMKISDFLAAFTHRVCDVKTRTLARLQ